MWLTTMQEIDLIYTAFSLLVLLFSVVAHEVSHGYMAQHLGDPTARLAGRLTLNPVSHIDPVGSILVPIVTALLPGSFIFGWAKPVPYNPYNLRDQRWGDAKVALAGPLTNIGIAVIFAILLRLGGDFFAGPMAALMHLIIFINIILAFFNLVPIPPLDGSKVLFAFLPTEWSRVQDFLERYGFFILLILVFLIPRILYSLVAPVVGFLLGLITGIGF